MSAMGYTKLLLGRGGALALALLINLAVFWARAAAHSRRRELHQGW